jgi:excisionase family DNA binding protein
MQIIGLRNSLSDLIMLRMIGTTEAAAKLGISPERVRALIKAGRLPAQKLGRDWFIEEKNLALVKNRKPGRPRTQGTPKAKGTRTKK